MLGRVLLIHLLLAPLSASGGWTYTIQTSTTGPRPVMVSGRVTAEGSRIRVDMTHGDAMLFGDHAIVLSNDGGRTMSVFDPDEKTWYELHLDDVLGSATAMLRKMGPGIDIRFENPAVNVRDGGDGGTLQGYPTHKMVIDASYDVAIDAMGQKLVTHTKITTESWNTDRLSSGLTSFLQMRGSHTGIEAVDKLIEAQTGATRGFPLKQVSTIRAGLAGQEAMTITSTAAVSDIHEKAVDPATFAVPPGYTKVEDPLSKMMGQLRK